MYSLIMITLCSAKNLAEVYKKTGFLNFLNLCELLEFILYSEDNISIDIANNAFANENIFKGFHSFKSPLDKYETYGCFHPDEINIFVYYFKWSLNYDAIIMRKFAKLMKIINQ